MRENELPKEAFDMCKRLHCGYCLTHEAPFTCCDKMKSLLTILEGKEWCEKNIKHYGIKLSMADCEPIGEPIKEEPRKQEVKDYIQDTLF